MLLSFCDFCEQLVILEDGSHPVLQPHQRKFWTLATETDSEGCFRFQKILDAEVKKSGKTSLNAWFDSWFSLFVSPPNDEVLILANDLEQAVGRVYREIRRVFRANPILRGETAFIGEKEIRLNNGTTIKAIPSDYTGEAGANMGLTSWDELWGYQSERSRRLWEELTPVPTRKVSIRLVTTTAGFSGESVLLEELYERAMAAEKISEEPPIYVDGELLCLWDHTARMPWQTKEYYTKQRRELRPNSFLRLHENRWVSSEDSLFDLEKWDLCVDQGHRPPLLSKDIFLFLGIDASTKKDRSAVVSVYREGDVVCLGPKRIWQPTKKNPIDLEETIEAYILWLYENYRLKSCHFDPFQFHRSAITLRKKGLSMVEYPQTVPNMTEAAQNLYDLIEYRRLRLYPDNSLRQEAAAAIGKETPRGFLIKKDKATQKIDQIIALSMAALACVKTERTRPWFGWYDWGTGEFEVEFLDEKKPIASEVVSERSIQNDPIGWIRQAYPGAWLWIVEDSKRFQKFKENPDEFIERNRSEIVSRKAF